MARAKQNSRARKKVIIEGELPALLIKEGDVFVSYAPDLDLSSCGDSQEEAKNNLREAIVIFVEECLEDGTLDEVLTSLGWHRERKPSGRWIPPHFEFAQIPIAIAAKK